MMKNWIMSVLGQQPSRKRTKMEIDLRFEKQSFRPTEQLSSDDDAEKSASTSATLDENDCQFKSPNAK